MTEKRVGSASPTSIRPGRGAETQAAAALFKKGQSASNLLGALASKPPAAGDGGSGAGSSPTAEATSKKR
jgi:hypothetical protein